LGNASFLVAEVFGWLEASMALEEKECGKV
jgi:hypothetical protein